MPSTKPSVLKVWQESSPPDRQPTCHDARNPVAPWLGLEQDSEDAIEDRAFVRAWANSRASYSLASQVNLGDDIVRRPRKARPDTAAPSGNANLSVPVSITPVIVEIEQAIEALTPAAGRAPRAMPRKECDGGDQ